MKLRPGFIVLVVLAAALAHPAAAMAQATWNSVTVSWTTPGDDGSIGTATQFDLRYSTSPINATNFVTATRWNATPTPTGSGTRQNVTVTGLLPSTTYYFAIKTGDEVPNWAAISNVISKTTGVAPDTIRPAPVAVNTGTITDTTAVITWNAVGDDSLSGRATSYDVRYSTSPITVANWGGATQASNEPVPGVSGAPESFTVRNLSRQVTYYFAVRVSDESGNVSALSNTPSVTTPDTAPPAAITDLTAGFVWFGWNTLATRVTPIEVERP